MPYWSGAFAPPQTPVVHRYGRVSHRQAARKVPAAVAPPIQEVKETGPEPRFTSAEWWARENARLGKVTQICNGCLPQTTVTAAFKVLNPLPPIPMLPNKQSEFQGAAAQALP